MKRYFEFTDEKSAKFWEIDLAGLTLTTGFGKIGTSGRTSEKEYENALLAEKEYDKLISEKTKKGYVEVQNTTESLAGNSIMGRKSAKKKSTLPKKIKELIENNEIEAIKEIFKTCEIDARGGYDNGAALSFYKISDELISWLIEQGADINARDTHKRTPLHSHASSWCGNVKLLLELGADIEALDNDDETPLHASASGFRTEAVKVLISHGADVNAVSKRHQTPLEKALMECRNTDIVEMSKISKILIEHGAKISDSMKESVKKIGKNFEFSKESFNKESLPQTVDALNILYDIFAVDPIKSRISHDGISSIKVTSGNWKEQYDELWDFLVPAQGCAKTIQGETIRITGRISHEIIDNGACNWDKDHKKMLDALKAYLRSGNPLSDTALEEANILVKEIYDGFDNEKLSELCELAVKWVLINPEPVPMKEPNYKR
jgi:predicted DNA-binding WGR domain protein